VDILSWPGPYPQQAGSYPPLDLGKPFARPAAKRSKLVAVHKSKQSREASAGNENRVPGGLAGQSIGKTKLQKGDPQYDKRAWGGDWGSGGEARGHEEGLPRAGKVTDWGDGIGRSGERGHIWLVLFSCFSPGVLSSCFSSCLILHAFSDWSRFVMSRLITLL
jgi:hypothetical protein